MNVPPAIEARARVEFDIAMLVEGHLDFEGPRHVPVAFVRDDRGRPGGSAQ
jgi:hypothetical protein